MLDGLWSIIDNDRNHGERLVGVVEAFVPDIPLFSALNEITSLNIEVEIKSDLDEQEIGSQRLLQEGCVEEINYISPTNFDDCKHDFMRVAHLFNMTIFGFVRRYGEIPVRVLGCKELLLRQWVHSSNRLFKCSHIYLMTTSTYS